MAGFMIAAPRSGSGKTMVTCGILELLKRKQKNPFSYKCGPDYIDGLFHRKVLGIEGGNWTVSLNSHRILGKNMQQCLKRIFQ